MGHRKCAVLIILLFLSLSTNAYAAEENSAKSANSKQTNQAANAAGQPAEDSKQKFNDLTVTGKVGVGTDQPSEKLEVAGKIKTTEGLCIGQDCKNSWPEFKCAEYDRPAGESGNSFCQANGKTCMAVSLGNGSTFFGECGATSDKAHKTRCCWIE